MAGGESSHSSAWVHKIMDLPYKINQTIYSVIIYEEQCRVLKALVDSAALYSRVWWSEFSEEIQSTSAATIGFMLLRVLNAGLRLLQQCADNDSPSIMLILLGGTAQFYEIVDDAKKYIQMMNDLLLTSSAQIPSKQQVIAQLRHMVDVDCNMFLTILGWASGQDKLTLLERLKSPISESETSGSRFTRILSNICTVNSYKTNVRKIGGISNHVSASCLIPVLTGTLSEEATISQNDLEQDREIGRGSYATVRIGRWCKLPVAVKEFAHEQKENFKIELGMFGKMLPTGSSHIVQVVGHAKQSNGSSCLVLELMDTNLAKLIAERKKIKSTSDSSPFELSESVDIMLQIAKAMRDLHRMNIMHRDLKPANVFVNIIQGDASYQIKLANVVVSAGTPIYMASEVMDGVSYSRKVDVHSFGMVCYEILTGNKPFSNDLRRRPSLPEDIPPGLAQLISACWDEAECPDFAFVVDQLWLLYEQILTSSDADSYVPSSEIWEVQQKEESGAKIDVHSISIIPQIPTPTGKRAIFWYYINSYSVDEKYYVRSFLTDYVVDIYLGYLDVDRYGNIHMVSTSTTIQDPTEDLGVLGQFKLLKTEGKKFNLSIAIGGPNRSKYFSDAFSTAETRATFISAVVDFLKAYPIFNGIVIDWRFVSDNGKNYGKKGNVVRGEDGNNFILVLEKLRHRLPSGFTISASTWVQTIWPFKSAIPHLDRLHIITNFQHGYKAIHRSNLYPTSSMRLNIDEAINFYISKGVPSSKLFIEVVLYTYEYADADGMGKFARSSETCRPYNEVPCPGFEEKWDDEAKATYAYNPIQRVVHTYDDARSIVEKANYIKANNLGGIVIGAPAADYPPNHDRSITRALYNNLTHPP